MSDEKGLVVLSLFDGMSCGQIALNRCGFKIDRYYASEIDKHAIKVTMSNFPDTIQLGNVLDVDVSQLPHIDLLLGGSPCQSFSFAGKRKGMSTKCSEEVYTLDRYLELKADGYAFEGQSYLFWEYMRILTELRKVNPDVKFLLENVEMGEKWERVLSKAIGVNGIHINSALLSAQSRKRIYWIGQIRERIYYHDSYCYICRHGREKESSQQGIYGATSNQGAGKILGETQERQRDLRDVQLHFPTDQSQRGSENLLEDVSGRTEKEDRQEQEQGGSRRHPQKIHREEQGKVAPISKGLQTDSKGQGNSQEVRGESIEKSSQTNENSSSSRAWNKEEANKRRVDYYSKHGEDLCCVQCGKKLDLGSQNSIIERGDKSIVKPSSSLSEMQFNEARQNNGRVYDVLKIGVKGNESLFGEEEPSIPQPKDKGILLKDILEKEVDEKYFLSEKMLNYFRSRAANFNNGKVNIRNEDEKATCLTSSMSSCDISDNFIKVDTRLRVAPNQDKSSCFTAGGNSGGMHSDMDLIIQPKARDVIQVNPSLESGGKQPYQQNSIYDTNGLAPALMAQISSGTHAILHHGSIRRLTPIECERLQTVEDNYTAHVSTTQRYRMLGNGWTIDAICHILQYMKPA